MEKNSKRILFKDIIFMKYNDSKTGSMFVELEYIQYDNTWNYKGITYSDADLEKYVESNPQVLRKIDADLRNHLKQKYHHSFS
jgi:hypothetical protein